MDKYNQISVSKESLKESLKHFCIAIRAKFETYYLRQFNWTNFEKQLAINFECEFLGMFYFFKLYTYITNGRSVLMFSKSICMVERTK